MKLPHTTRQRLQLYKTRAAANKCGWNDWRGHRYARTWEPTAWTWSEDRRKIYADERDTLGDYLGDWGTFLRGRCWDATGFYSDNWQNDTIKGGVEKIRTPRGVLYVPITYCTGWDGVIYYMHEAHNVPKGCNEASHEEAQKEAAAAAYHYAEREAERYRDEDAQQQAADQIEQERAEIHEINKNARALLAEIRGREFTENVCAALRHRLHEYLAHRRACFKTIEGLRENYWNAVPY